MLTHWIHPPATHQPVLHEIASRCDGPILEFGCGEGSTPLLHEVCSRRGLRLLSLETEPAWMNRYAPSMQSRQHEFRLVSDWDELLASAEWDEHRWGLVFVDQHPWEARAKTIHRLRLNTDYVILHDCDHMTTTGLLGRSLRPIEGPHDIGERSYDDVFSSWKEYFPPEPWPLPSTGPPTLLGSNARDCELDLDYRKYQPPWPRRALYRIATRLALNGIRR